MAGETKSLDQLAREFYLFAAAGGISGGAGGGLTDAELRADEVPVSDDYLTGSITASQAGAGAVLNFNLTVPCSLVWVRDIGASTGNVSFADPFGGVPADGVGIPIPNGEPVPITVLTSVVKVWAPGGSTICVYGYGR